MHNGAINLKIDANKLEYNWNEKSLMEAFVLCTLLVIMTEYLERSLKFYWHAKVYFIL